MKVLIIAAHGSRKKASNSEVAALARKIAEKTGPAFDRVEHAFLQFAAPLLETTLKEVAQNGADRIVIFPFFIGSGSHITMDIPRLVETLQQDFPDIDIRVTRHLGKIESIEEMIVREVLS